MISNDAMLKKERQACLNPESFWKLLPRPRETDLQHQYLAQATPTPIQGQCQDYKQSILEQHLTHCDADIAMEQSSEHRHVDLSSSDEEHHFQSSVLISECHCEHSENRSVARVKLMCRFKFCTTCITLPYSGFRAR
ncbi:hypothetical protein GOP47_0029015 [Adiantum capillus-veneris]|nr:hypothetical protein GOP47_0029015 [Adiantum capillus-veneris]